MEEILQKFLKNLKKNKKQDIVKKETHKHSKFVW